MLEIQVCSLKEIHTGLLLGLQPDAIISLISHRQDLEDRIFQEAHGNKPHLVLEFDDVENPNSSFWLPPTKQDIQSILVFGRQIRINNPDAHLVVHCHAGISRSTAGALIIMNDEAGPGQERELCQKLRKMRPQAHPNSLMIKYGQEILGRDDPLVIYDPENEDFPV